MERDRDPFGGSCPKDSSEKLPLRGWGPGVMPAHSLGWRRWEAHLRPPPPSPAPAPGAWKPPGLGPAQAPSPFLRGEQGGEAGAIGARDRIPELYRFVSQDLEALRKRKCANFHRSLASVCRTKQRRVLDAGGTLAPMVVPSCVLPGAPVLVFLSLVAMSLSTL